jgi:hypothetical protein
VAVFVHKKEPDAAWVADLAKIAPRSEKVNWLKISWLPGIAYEPVQRWGVWEMIPELEYVDSEMLEDLRGLSPRDPTNGWWADDPGTVGVVPGDQLLSSSRLDHSRI